MSTAYSIPKDALDNPFARALIKDEPLVYDTEHTPLIDRQAQLCLLCEKWLKRDKQTLSQCVDEKRLRELDEELLRLIRCELDFLCGKWQISMALPIENKRGFLAFFMNMVASTSFACGISPQWKNADEAATDIVTYLRRGGDMLPLSQWQFDYIDDPGEWFKIYVSRRMQQLAEQNVTCISDPWETTKMSIIRRRKEVFNVEMEHYLQNRAVLDQLLPAQANLIRDFCRAFFLHMYRHIAPNDHLVSQIETVFETKRPSQTPETPMVAILNLQIPELKSDGHPSSRDLCDYIHARKKYDPDFKQYCQTHSLEEVCRKLEQAFNWGFRKDMIFGKINIDTLQKYLNRHGETIATI